MNDRRRFLKLGALGTAALAVGCAGTETTREETATKAPAAGPGGPVVLSTWDHGMVANARAWDVLRAGGSVLDAVEQGVAMVESDLTNRSVGLGGMPDRDGFVTLDACIQDHDGRAGAVAFLQDIEHPISVARAIMERTPHVMLVGDGAQQWALANGFTKREVDLPEVQAAYADWLKKAEYKPVANIENHDTIGLVALDANGKLAGSCTTSGMAFKVHGRVGDSPIIGAGLFVDGDVGAACATGTGELVMRQGVEPEEACRQAVKRILAKHPGLNGHQVGFLALRKDGLHGACALVEGFTYALHTKESNTLHKAAFIS
jgi:isoaspartyl peptidase/L-asparaginase-like protein (Ntn-hydrolase superfamily)